MSFPKGEGDLCQLALKSVHSSSKYSVQKFVTNERTDERRENIMPMASLYCHMDKKNSIVFADGIAFVCFYDAEHVLSAQ